MQGRHHRLSACMPKAITNTPMEAQRCVSADMSDLSALSMPLELDWLGLEDLEDACMDEGEAR